MSPKLLIGQLGRWIVRLSSKNPIASIVGRMAVVRGVRQERRAVACGELLSHILAQIGNARQGMR